MYFYFTGCVFSIGYSQELGFLVLNAELNSKGKFFHKHIYLFFFVFTMK